LLYDFDEFFKFEIFFVTATILL